MNEEWNTEPSDESWLDPITQYKCRIMRHETGLHLCGYVYVPESHPWFKRGYSETADGNTDFDLYNDRPEGIIDAHGGLTYSGNIKDDKDGAWCFGFDCAHSGDLSPGMQQYGLDTGIYRNWDYVKQECEQVAEQLAAFEPKVLTEEISA